MPPSNAAQRNHDELFPGHVSTLAQTDPELIESFDNFAFDEVLRESDLDARTRLMVQLAALIASHAVNEYRAMLGAALAVGVTPVEAKEIVYQAVPYVGLGKVFDFLHTTNEVFTERGVTLPLPGQSTTSPDTRAENGRKVQAQIIGEDTVEQLYATAPDDEQHIQRFLTANCFGDHLTRTGIDLRTRELLTFAMLVSLGGCEPQAKGPRGRQPQRRQRPRRVARRPHPTHPLHRLPTHAQRATNPRRGDVVTGALREERA
jgi:4-carboxymuconolactone decarboxylase